MLQAGEEAVKSTLQTEEGFLQLLTTAWPVWDLLATLEAAITPEDSSPTWAPPRDPREPECKVFHRKALTVGLENQRVEAIVVFGRKDRAKILHRYLQRNMRRNGGVLDRVMFVVFAAMEEDLLWLNQLVQTFASDYDIPAVTGRRLAKIYSVCTDPDTVYIKIDDDMVYMSDETIPEIVRERVRGRCALVSANVINHAILSAVHQDIGAIRHYFPVPEEELPPGSRPIWIRSDDSLALSVIEKKAQSECVWRMWQCAAWMHESFLSRVMDGTWCAYDFGWHDFHAHGHGAMRGEKFVPLPYTRWSINMIAFKMEDLAEAREADLAEDDESELAVMVHHRMNRRACAVGRALTAHFSYSLQEDSLLENTDLLARYDLLSVRLTGIES